MCYQTHVILFSVSSDNTVGPSSPVNAASSLPSNPSISSSGLTLLSVETLTDGVKLKSHLMGLKVPVLRQELKCRNIPLTGLSSKALLVSRLMELPLTVLQDPTSTTPKVANSILSPPSAVNCLPSHCCCGDLISTLTEQVKDLRQQMLLFSSQINSHIKTCNSKLLSNASSNYSDSIKKIKSDIDVINDRLGALSKPVTPSVTFSQSNSRFSGAPRRPSAPYKSPNTNDFSLHSPCSLRITDPCGLSDKFAIGHLIKGLFSWKYPNFQIIEGCFKHSPPSISYQVDIELDFSSFKRIWDKNVRSDIGLTMVSLSDTTQSARLPTCPSNTAVIPSSSDEALSSLSNDIGGPLSSNLMSRATPPLCISPASLSVLPSAISSSSAPASSSLSDASVPISALSSVTYSSSTPSRILTSNSGLLAPSKVLMSPPVVASHSSGIPPPEDSPPLSLVPGSSSNLNSLEGALSLPDVPPQ